MSDPLLAFDVGEVIGRGATAHVRRGRHRASGEPVAIKVFDRGRTHLASFEHELRVQASLLHPDILMVLDGGRLQEPVAGIASGTPYLVLEWASGGAASDAVLDTWESVRRVLETCLSGLARAHAAGIVHRDVKLGNVLRCTAADRRPGYKLADFGIATFAGERTNRAGTPASMAPEQIEGRNHEIGPGTDLYAVGCMAFRMVTGKAPVLTTDLDTALEGHLKGETVPYDPVLRVPGALERWIRSLMAVDPYDRPRTAAEALAALRALEDGWRGGAGAGRHEAAGTLPRGLARAGRRLAGLRLAPAVGRDAALDALGAHLDELGVAEVRLVWVRGPAGVGRTHVLRTFAVETETSGRAEVIRLDADWLQRWLGHRPPQGVEEHLARRFPEAGDALREDLVWLWGDPRGRLPANALRRVAEARHGRPLVVVVDDAPSQVRALTQVAGLFAQQPARGPGVLVVASVADGVSRGPWKALSKVGQVVLDPLPAGVLEAILVEQLGLSVPDASRAAADAGGLPREAFAAANGTGSVSMAWDRPDHPAVEVLLQMASVLSAAGPVSVDQWVELAEGLAPDGLEVLPDVVDALLDGGVATSLGADLRIVPSVLPAPVPAAIRDAVVARLPVAGAVRARAMHGDPEGAVAAALAHIADVGSDADPVLVDGLARATAGAGDADWQLRGRISLARLYTTLGDEAATEEVLTRCEALKATSRGRLWLAQRRMQVDLFAGRNEAVEATFQAHRDELAENPDEASVSWMLLALAPLPTVAGMPRHEAALHAEELASKSGRRTYKVEARRLLGELAWAEGRHRAAQEWLDGARTAARRRFCLPMLGVYLAEARFALAAGDRDRCRAALDEIDRQDVHGSRPVVLGALQRAELAVIEGDWKAVAVACERTLRLARDLDWTMVQWAAEALRAGVQGEARRWDAAERSVEGAITLMQHGIQLETVGTSLVHLAQIAATHGQDALAARAEVAAARHGVG